MGQLGAQILKNSGLSDKTRVLLESWMDNVEDTLAEIITAYEGAMAKYIAHCANDTAHNSADATNNDPDETIDTSTTPSH